LEGPLKSGALNFLTKVENKISKCKRAMKEIKKAFIDSHEDEKNFLKEIAIYRSLVR